MHHLGNIEYLTSTWNFSRFLSVFFELLFPLRSTHSSTTGSISIYIYYKLYDLVWVSVIAAFLQCHHNRHRRMMPEKH